MAHYRPQQTKRCKMLCITPEVIVSLLSQDGSVRYAVEGMPKDAKITAVTDNPLKLDEPHTVYLRIESETFDEIEDGTLMPNLDLTFRRIDAVPRGREFL